jgi:hypothetical protein
VTKSSLVILATTALLTGAVPSIAQHGWTTGGQSVTPFGTGQGSRTTVRYEVNPAYLVNLNELARTEHESVKVKADWRTAF